MDPATLQASRVLVRTWIGGPDMGTVPELKTCCKCGRERSPEEFCRCRAARDGRSSWCKDCQAVYMRTRRGDPESRRRNSKASDRRHPERRAAREKVKDAIRAGRIPSARTLLCKDCGHPAASYDHAFGYDRPLDVEAVCFRCHGLRSRGRGEHARVFIPDSTIKSSASKRTSCPTVLLE